VTTVKHALQNIQNDCHQRLSRSFTTALECTKFVFGQGCTPEPLGELTATATSWFKGGHTSKGRGHEGKEGERMGVEGRGEEGRGGKVR